ncbi:MAG: hypothetical protein J6K45_04705 [Clostridia bacterium]|nr:hypothetical protein [Clostridia bacterium]
MEYIQLKERKDIFRLGFKDTEGNIIYDKDGKEVCIEFDLGDIDLPIKYNKCVTQINDARRELKNKFIIINKQKDRKGKGFLSHNEEEKTKVIKEFYKKMESSMDLFLGQGGTQKFLNGKKIYWEVWDDISEALKPHMDKLHLTVEDMENRIKNKYSLKEEKEVLKDV